MADQHRTLPIVAGIDGSTSARHAAQWAAREAAQRGLPLRLVHVHVTPMVGYPVAPLSEDAENALVEQAHGWLAQAADAVREVAPDVTPELVLLAGPTASATLLDQSRSAEFVALGSRGLGGVAAMVIGSVAAALAAHGASPVVVVRGRTPEDPPPLAGPVVVGVDGSPVSEAALAFALAEASWRGAELVAVHTWSEVVTETFDTAGVLLDWEAIEHDERRLLAQRLAGWQEKYPDVPIRRVVTRDRPVRSLLEHGQDAQLIVVGSRGRGGFTGMLLGSTSRALLHHAPCPLAVIRPELG